MWLHTFRFVSRGLLKFPRADELAANHVALPPLIALHFLLSSFILSLSLSLSLTCSPSLSLSTPSSLLLSPCRAPRICFHLYHLGFLLPRPVSLCFLISFHVISCSVRSSASSNPSISIPATHDSSFLLLQVSRFFRHTIRRIVHGRPASDRRSISWVRGKRVRRNKRWITILN